MSSKNLDGLGSRQHSDSYSLSQHAVQVMQTMLKIASKNRMIFLARKKRARAEERTFDEVDRWDRSDTTDPEILNHIRKFLDD